MGASRRFYYRASDRKVAAALVAFAAICLGAIVFIGERNDETGNVGEVDSLGVINSCRKGHRQRRDTLYYYEQPHRHERFPFDPNTADSTTLLRLGLRPWQVRSIYKYRAAGGVYGEPRDFAKLYGLTAKEYKELEPYIRIAADYRPAAELPLSDTYKHHRDTVLYPKKIQETERINLNTADTTLLKRVPGIGSHYARNIVKYGERLGGYANVNQLDEIEGFPMEAKKYFVVTDRPHRLINVNTATLNEIRRHPYMGFFRAKSITEYRRLHGKITDLNDLRFDRSFTPDAIKRLRPYIEY